MAQIFIGIGSNISREQHIIAGVRALVLAFGQLHISRVYESAAIGFDGSSFLNLVVGVEVELTVEQVVNTLKAIEDNNGRVRDGSCGGWRTLDLDLLLYNNLVCQTPAQLPRAEILKNAFVLWPLSELAGQKTHPIAQQSYAKLWQNYDKSKQALHAIEFDWPDDINSELINFSD